MHGLHLSLVVSADAIFDLVQTVPSMFFSTSCRGRGRERKENIGVTFLPFWHFQEWDFFRQNAWRTLPKTSADYDAQSCCINHTQRHEITVIQSFNKQKSTLRKLKYNTETKCFLDPKNLKGKNSHFYSALAKRHLGHAKISCKISRRSWITTLV